MIGQLLAGHYRILQVLGTGGFGQTYIAEDTHRPGNPKCVVKHLKPASSATQVLGIARTLFKKEAETLERLGSYEHIPRLLAYFEENKEFYLVQEYIDGYPLSKELPPGKKWSESQITELLIEILGILKFIHSQGVIHRDIKPDNIIRKASDRKLVLIDFGAIKQVRQTVIATGQQSLTVAIGTPGYMPTEQSRGTPRPNSDIYALGMIGIQALTGVYPSKLHELYEDPDTGELLWQSQATVSPELAAVLTKMTQYHFKDRYQTASEALQAIEQLSHPYTATVQPTTISHARVELTLEWVEAGLIKSRTILENQPSKNPGTVRIGRDPQACDIVLSDPTVSGLHVEIFFDSQQQRFKVRNLRSSNPPLVDGQLLSAGEVPLDPNSSLRLGQLDLRVASISLKQYSTSGGYSPTVYPTQPPSQPPQPIPKTVQPPSASNSVPQISVTPSNPSVVGSFASKLPLLIGLGVAAVVSASGVFAYIILVPSPAPDTSQVKVSPSTPSKSPEAIAPDKPDEVKPSPPSVTPSSQDEVKPSPPSVTPSTQDEVKPSPPSVTPVIINNQTTPQQQNDSVKQPDRERSQQQDSVKQPDRERSQQQDSVKQPDRERSQQQDSVKQPDRERSQQQTTDPSSPSSQSNSNSNSSPKPTENPIQNQPPDNEGINILAEARVLATEGNLAAAISKAEQVPVDSSAYQDAQDEKALWQQQLESQNSEPSPTSTETPSQNSEPSPTPTQTPSQNSEPSPTSTETPTQIPETPLTPTQTPTQIPETPLTPTQTPTQIPETPLTPTQTP